MDFNSRVFGKIIKEKRKQLKLNTADVAEMIGKSTRMIQRIESGERLPSYETLLNICKALNCTTDDIFGSFLSEVEPRANTSVFEQIIAMVSAMETDKLQAVLNILKEVSKF